MKKFISNIYTDSLLRNSTYLMISNFSVAILGFFFWIIAARYYTPDNIGMTSVILSGVSLVAMISSVGLSKALFFYLPRDPENANRRINSCLMANILISIIFSLIFILGINVWTPGLKTVLNNLENMTIFLTITVTITISGLIGAAFSAGRRSSYSMAKEIIYHLTKIFPLFILTVFGFMGILLSFGIGLTVSTIIGFILLSKVWNYHPMITFDPIIKDMINFSAGNYIADILYNLPRLIFPIIILNLISDRSAGYFYIAFTVAGLLYGIPQSISTSLLVESSDKERLSNNIDKAIKFNLGLLIPGVLLFIIFGKVILTIFNPIYAENSFDTMIILVLTSIPLSLVNIFNTIRNAQNRVPSLIKMNLLITMVTIILSIFLIKIGIEGLAISFLVANTIGAIRVIYRVKNPIGYTKRLIKDYRNIIHICFG